MTAAKKASQTFQPTPVRWAMRSIRFMVPRTRDRVESNESFIFSMKAVESRISVPMASDMVRRILTLERMPDTCASFCDSRDSSVAVSYWPLSAHHARQQQQQ
jgi:hypothetical protein